MLGGKEKKAAATSILGTGGPQGQIEGEKDSLYLDTANALVWIKEFEGKKVGWKCLGRLIPDSIETVNRMG